MLPQHSNKIYLLGWVKYFARETLKDRSCFQQNQEYLDRASRWLFRSCFGHDDVDQLDLPPDRTDVADHVRLSRDLPDGLSGGQCLQRPRFIEGDVT